MQPLLGTKRQRLVSILVAMVSMEYVSQFWYSGISALQVLGASVLPHKVINKSSVALWWLQRRSCLHLPNRDTCKIWSGIEKHHHRGSALSPLKKKPAHFSGFAPWSLRARVHYTVFYCVQQCRVANVGEKMSEESQTQRQISIRCRKATPKSNSFTKVY